MSQATPSLGTSEGGAKQEKYGLGLEVVGGVRTQARRELFFFYRRRSTAVPVQLDPIRSLMPGGKGCGANRSVGQPLIHR